MATILRAEGSAGKGYRARYDKVSLAEISGRTRCLPSTWITPDGMDVTDDFVRYAQPLLGEGWPPIPMEHGLQRFVSFRYGCGIREDLREKRRAIALTRNEPPLLR